jgi:hypothetical protein
MNILLLIEKKKKIQMIIIYRMTKLGRWFRENLKLNNLVALQFVAEIPQKAKQIHEIIFSITVTSSSYKAPPPPKATPLIRPHLLQAPPTKGHPSY